MWRIRRDDDEEAANFKNFPSFPGNLEPEPWGRKVFDQKAEDHRIETVRTNRLYSSAFVDNYSIIFADFFWHRDADEIASENVASGGRRRQIDGDNVEFYKQRFKHFFRRHHEIS